MEKEKIRLEITSRFLDAVEYIVKTDKASGYRDITRQSGIEHQRINDIKSFIKKEGKTSYPSIEYFYQLENIYGISSRWIITGQGSMILNNVPEDDSYELIVSDLKHQYSNKEGVVQRLAVLEKEMHKVERLLGIGTKD